MAPIIVDHDPISFILGVEGEAEKLRRLSNFSLHTLMIGSGLEVEFCSRSSLQLLHGHFSHCYCLSSNPTPVLQRPQPRWSLLHLRASSLALQPSAATTHHYPWLPVSTARSPFCLSSMSSLIFDLLPSPSHTPCPALC